MECPYCKSEMEKGFFRSRNGLQWYPIDKHVFFLAFVSRKGTINISNGGFEALAYCCKNCEKILIDYSESNARV